MVPKTWRPAARQGISNFDSTVKNIDNVWSKLKSSRLGCEYTMIISRPSSTATFWYYYWITATSLIARSKNIIHALAGSHGPRPYYTRSYYHSPESSHFWLKTWNNTFKFFLSSYGYGCFRCIQERKARGIVFRRNQNSGVDCMVQVLSPSSFLRRYLCIAFTLVLSTSIFFCTLPFPEPLTGARSPSFYLKSIAYY